MTGKHTDKTREKISKARQGKCLGNKNALGNTPWNKGLRGYTFIGKKGKGLGNQNAKGNILSEATRKQMGLSRIGNKNAFKHGLTPTLVLIRMSKSYTEWRKKVFERDNHTCQNCEARSKKGNRIILNADHILPFSTFPQERLNVANGRTLCVPCHKATPTFGSRALLVKQN